MKRSHGGWALMVLCLCLHPEPASAAEPPTGTSDEQRETATMTQVEGTFDVKLTPQADTAGDPSIARMTIDKQFHGPLEATSKGQMLATQTGVDGSAGYVAMERVTGTLDGRAGSFTFQHSGTMDRGKPSLTLTVVPDSATDELTGLTGRMAIDIVDGTHHYTFDYALAPLP